MESKKFVVKTKKSYYERTDTMDVISNKTGRSRNELVLMCVDFALNNIQIVDDDSPGPETKSETK